MGASSKEVRVQRHFLAPRCNTPHRQPPFLPGPCQVLPTTYFSAPDAPEEPKKRAGGSAQLKASWEACLNHAGSESVTPGAGVAWRGPEQSLRPWLTAQG